MSEIIPIKTIAAPAIASAFGYQEDDLSQGASQGFPVLTYRGKVWRVSHKGETHILKTPDGDPIPSVRLIMLAANAHLSKIYYEKSYSEGDSEAPDCFSSNGDVPDSNAKSPQSTKCATCPQAAWGSRMSDEGKELKACQDSRRLVVVPSNDIANEMFGGPMLLRVPAASLGNLAAYSSLLKQANAAYFGVATKIGFDMEAAYPKLTFEYDGPATERLTADDANTILKLRESDEAARILNSMSKQEHGEPALPKPPAKEVPKSVTPPPVVNVPEEQITKPVAEEPSPPPVAETGVVEAATVSDVDDLVSGLLS